MEIFITWISRSLSRGYRIDDVEEILNGQSDHEKSLLSLTWDSCSFQLSSLGQICIRLRLHFLLPCDCSHVCNAEDLGSIPGSGKSTGEGNGNPFQYFCLENSTDRGAWGLVSYSPRDPEESDMTKWHTHTHAQLRLFDVCLFKLSLPH